MSAFSPVPQPASSTAPRIAPASAQAMKPGCARPMSHGGGGPSYAELNRSGDGGGRTSSGIGPPDFRWIQYLQDRARTGHSCSFWAPGALSAAELSRSIAAPAGDREGSAARARGSSLPALVWADKTRGRAEACAAAFTSLSWSPRASNDLAVTGGGPAAPLHEQRQER